MCVYRPSTARLPFGDISPTQVTLVFSTDILDSTPARAMERRLRSMEQDVRGVREMITNAPTAEPTHITGTHPHTHMQAYTQKAHMHA